MRLVCFGDSNTYGYDPRSFFGGRYPAECRWTDLLAERTGLEVVNLGQNGREIPPGAGSLSGLLRRDDLLVVMLGDNDLLYPPPIPNARLDPVSVHRTFQQKRKNGKCQNHRTIKPREISNINCETRLQFLLQGEAEVSPLEVPAVCM